jgi:hypothetical protein
MAMPSWTHDAGCKHETGDYCYKIMGFSTRLLEEIYQGKEENLEQLDEDSYLQERSCKSKPNDWQPPAFRSTPMDFASLLLLS